MVDSNESKLKEVFVSLALPRDVLTTKLEAYFHKLAEKDIKRDQHVAEKQTKEYFENVIGDAYLALDNAEDIYLDCNIKEINKWHISALEQAQKDLHLLSNAGVSKELHGKNKLSNVLDFVENEINNRLNVLVDLRNLDFGERACLYIGKDNYFRKERLNEVVLALEAGIQWGMAKGEIAYPPNSETKTTVQDLYSVLKKGD